MRRFETGAAIALALVLAASPLALPAHAPAVGSTTYYLQFTPIHEAGVFTASWANSDTCGDFMGNSTVSLQYGLAEAVWNYTGVCDEVAMNSAVITVTFTGAYQGSTFTATCTDRFGFASSALSGADACTGSYDNPVFSINELHSLANFTASASTPASLTNSTTAPPGSTSQGTGSPSSVSQISLGTVALAGIAAVALLGTLGYLLARRGGGKPKTPPVEPPATPPVKPVTPVEAPTKPPLGTSSLPSSQPRESLLVIDEPNSSPVPPPVRTVPTADQTTPSPSGQAKQDQSAPCCGPDVTDNVLRCMIRLMHDFFSWNKEDQEEHLGWVTSVLYYANAWDIVELGPNDAETEKKYGPQGYKLMLTPYAGRCMKPDPPCYPSVIFLENCHNPQVVNYVMYGVISRLGNPRLPSGSVKGRDPGPQDYSETDFSSWHRLRSGGTKVSATDLVSSVGGKLTPANPDYQDQVAMASVGWRLADDYIKLMALGRLPESWTFPRDEHQGLKMSVDVAPVDKAALTAILVAKQNKMRQTAGCLNRCPKMPPVQPAQFGYFWSNERN